MIKTNLSALLGGFSGISYVIGNFCLFSYLNSVGASVPLDSTSWLTISVLITIVTLLLWVPVGITLFAYLFLLEYAWRVFAFGARWTFFPFGLKQNFLSLTFDYKPSLSEIMAVLRNSLFFFFLFVLASWKNCSQAERFYRFNWIWGFAILWMLYFSLRSTWLNEQFFDLLKRKKFKAFCSPLTFRLCLLLGMPFLLLVNYILFLESFGEKFGLLFLDPAKQLSVILGFTNRRAGKPLPSGRG